MASFTSSLSPTSDAFVVFVNEKYEYKDNKAIFPKDISQKIDSFLKVLKTKNKKDEINSLDISTKKKMFYY